MDSKQLQPSSIVETTMRRIMAANPTAMLTGGLALKMHNVVLRRAPMDIDIIVAPGYELIIPLNLGEQLTRGTPSFRPDQENKEDDRYADEGTERHPYTLTANSAIQVKIDCFQCVTAEAWQARKYYSSTREGILVNEPRDILASKLRYAMQQDAKSRHKHLTDLLFLLSNPTKQ